MQAILWSVVSWLLREVIVKFFIVAGVYVVITVMLPLMLDLLSPYLGVASLTQAFASLPPNLWFFLEVARLDVGLPSLLTVAVSLFILRRVPYLNVK